MGALLVVSLSNDCVTRHETCPVPSPVLLMFKVKSPDEHNDDNCILQRDPVSFLLLLLFVYNNKIAAATAVDFSMKKAAAAANS